MKAAIESQKQWPFWDPGGENRYQRHPLPVAINVGRCRSLLRRLLRHFDSVVVAAVMVFSAIAAEILATPNTKPVQSDPLFFDDHHYPFHQCRCYCCRRRPQKRIEYCGHGPPRRPPRDRDCAARQIGRTNSTFRPARLVRQARGGGAENQDDYDIPSLFRCWAPVVVVVLAVVATYSVSFVVRFGRCLFDGCRTAMMMIV
mmetsp:Transcript_19949/g.55034  ORF Transcript_19949/g.55034 Transcript_19949/m.55034 type:complete len:201 (+) Transcript_19949:687-1289(+)